MKQTVSPSHFGRLTVIFVTAFFFFISRTGLFAHDPGLSSAILSVGPKSLTAEVTFNERDLAAAAGTTVDEIRSGNAKEKLDAIARRSVQLRSGNEVVEPSSLAAGAEGENNVALRYEFPLKASHSGLTFDSLLLKEMSFGHRQALSAVTGDGKEITRRILSARDSVASLPVATGLATAAPGSGGRFAAYFMLGVEHIITGYDHLLFLFGLLLVCRTPRSALVLITCFTLAHSLTLGLATFGLINLPGRFVEATIAASILYVGIENLFGRGGLLRWRWLLTLCFGLIHGLGFAGVLEELGIAKQGRDAVVPLLAFNTGVEAGQLAIASIALPLLWKLRQWPAFVRIGVPACSLLVAAAGAYWLFERAVLA